MRSIEERLERTRTYTIFSNQDVNNNNSIETYLSHM